MIKNIQYLSQEKFNELKKELEELKTVKRKEVTESLEFAKSLGDLSENAEYQEAREMQVNVEQRVAVLENIIKDAVIVSANNKDFIGMGSIIVVKNEADKEAKQFQIVGSEESDILTGKISNVSPLGAALMSKKVGEVVSLTTPKGPVKYKIIEIK